MDSGILLLYHHPVGPNAATISEHVHAFGRFSRHRVVAVNTEFGLPPALRERQFAAIVLHYSLFGTVPYEIDPASLALLRDRRGTVLIAFFQDEYHHCRQRFAFINDYRVDCVYTLVEPRYWDQVYRAYTRVPELVHTLTGYVGPEITERARRHAKPDGVRTLDVGYRARHLHFYMGVGAQEKTRIADEFVRRTIGRGLRLDIDTAESNRLYGDAWDGFLGNCRAVLGVEAGVSIFDLDGAAEAAANEYLARHPGASFDEVHAAVLAPFEGPIEYRTISPRHFEAAAFRTVQILFEGHYNGILEADRHYLALRKDFSNLDDVLRRLADPAERRRVTDAAYDDLIGAGRYTYATFVEAFDARLAERGILPRDGGRLAGLRVTLTAARHARAVMHERERVARALQRDAERLVRRRRRAERIASMRRDVQTSLDKWRDRLRYGGFPGRGALKRIYRYMFPLDRQ